MADGFVGKFFRIDPIKEVISDVCNSIVARWWCEMYYLIVPGDFIREIFGGRFLLSESTVELSIHVRGGRCVAVPILIFYVRDQFTLFRKSGIKFLITIDNRI